MLWCICVVPQPHHIIFVLPNHQQPSADTSTLALGMTLLRQTPNTSCVFYYAWHAIDVNGKYEYSSTSSQTTLKGTWSIINIELTSPMLTLSFISNLHKWRLALLLYYKGKKIEKTPISEVTCTRRMVESRKLSSDTMTQRGEDPRNHDLLTCCMEGPRNHSLPAGTPKESQPAGKQNNWSILWKVNNLTYKRKGKENSIQEEKRR